MILKKSQKGKPDLCHPQNLHTLKICTYMVQLLLASDFTEHMWINTVNQVNRTEGSRYVTIM